MTAVPQDSGQARADVVHRVGRAGEVRHDPVLVQMDPVDNVAGARMNWRGGQRHHGGAAARPRHQVAAQPVADPAIAIAQAHPVTRHDRPVAQLQRSQGDR